MRKNLFLKACVILSLLIVAPVPAVTPQAQSITSSASTGKDVKAFCTMLDDISNDFDNGKISAETLESELGARIMNSAGEINMDTKLTYEDKESIKKSMNGLLFSLIKVGLKMNGMNYDTLSDEYKEGIQAQLKLMETEIGKKIDGCETLGQIADKGFDL
ncbi:MAG: hypothetical protein K2K84_01600 [Muribaculaceae bacterium]|nr:hypothetical protein [Muribaculaceae bacterium]